MNKLTNREKVFEVIHNSMKENGSDWTKQWASSLGLGHRNIVTMKGGKTYNIFNQLNLSFTKYGHAPRWSTMRLWATLGYSCEGCTCEAQVVGFGKGKYQKDKESGEKVWVKGGATYTNVFSAEQVHKDGVTYAEANPLPTESQGEITDAQRIEAIEAFIKNCKVDIRYGGDRAFYCPSGDFIQMPNIESFHSTDSSKAIEAFYTTLLHELAHWSGSKHRLNRIKHKSFGDKAYSMEELVAEISAAVLAVELGIYKEGTTRDDHAKYLNGWIQKLTPHAFFDACAKADQACTFLHNLQSTQQKVA